LDTFAVGESEGVWAADSDALAVFQFKSLSARLSRADSVGVSLESSSTSSNAFVLVQFLAWLAIDGFAFSINQGKTIEALDLNALVQEAVPLLALNWAVDFRALSIDELVTIWTADSNALSIFKFEVSLAADSGAFSIRTLDESSVTFFDTS
jgi:hypothetical protein